jgi:hypothetical protein
MSDFYLASHLFTPTLIPSLLLSVFAGAGRFVLLHGDDTFSIDGVYPRDKSKAYKDEIIRAVGDAIEVGYRHFDGGPIYGNEVEVGQAIRQKIDDAIIDRKDLFIVSKVNREICASWVYVIDVCSCYFRCRNREIGLPKIVFRN